MVDRLSGLKEDIDTVWVVTETEDRQGAVRYSVVCFGPGQWQHIRITDGIALGVGRQIRRALGGVPMVDRMEMAGQVVHADSGHVFGSLEEAKNAMQRMSRVVCDNLTNRITTTKKQLERSVEEADQLKVLMEQRGKLTELLPGYEG